MLDKGEYAALADFQPSAILVYRTLVLRRSPLATRPPAIYRLAWSGRFYDVWERPLLADASVGLPARAGGGAPTARPGCEGARSLAAREGTPTPSTILVGLGHVGRPPGWSAAPDALVVYPSGAGTMTAPIRLGGAGRYSVWIGGSFRHHLAAFVDGRSVGSRTHQLNNAGQYTLLGELTLDAGEHTVELRYTSNALTPGSGGAEYGLGPLVVSGSPKMPGLCRS
jgi:hypothetical protein